MRPKLDESAALERWRKLWEKRRQHGKLSFVLLWGVLGWGGFTFVAMTCLQVFAFHDKLRPLLLVANALIWTVTGIGFGLWMWDRSEGQYHETREH
jgi:hypothetical protein